MLVVVHYRNIQLLPEALLNIKAIGSRDILEVYASKSWRQNFNGFYKLIGVFGIKFKVKDIDVGKNFKQNGFAFHNRF